MLSILEIHDDIANVTERIVNVAFRKRAKQVHPDKAGPETKAALQQLLDAYTS